MAPHHHSYKPLLEYHLHDEAFHVVPQHKGENTEVCDWLHLDRGSQKETEQGRHEGCLGPGSRYFTRNSQGAQAMGNQSRHWSRAGVYLDTLTTARLVPG